MARPIPPPLLERATEERRQVRLRYRGAQRQPGERCVEPAELRLHGGHLYATAWDLAKQDWRVFKVARILSAELLAQPASTHPPYDADAVFAHSIGVWSGEATDVRVRLAREKAPFAVMPRGVEHSGRARHAPWFRVDLAVMPRGVEHPRQWPW